MSIGLLSAMGVVGCNPSPEDAATLEAQEPRAQTEERKPEPETKAAAKAPVKKADRVILAPATSTTPGIEYDPATGRTALHAATLKSLLRYAYSINPKQIEITIPIDLTRRYDVLIEPAYPSLMHVRMLLRERLDREFNMTTSRESRTVPVFWLERFAESEEPPETRAAKRVIQNAEGRFRGRRATMADLAHFASLTSYKPVLDRTGLQGTYDLDLEWDPSAGTEAARKAFRDAGFQLVDGEGPANFLVVRRANAGGTAPKSTTP